MIFSAWPTCSPVNSSSKASRRAWNGNKPGFGADRHLEDLLRRACRDFLDLDAPLGAGHQDRHAEGAIQHHADINFAGDVGGFLDEHLRDLLPFGVGLLRDERILEHDLGDVTGVVALGNEFDAAEIGTGVLEASLAAAAGVNLGLENDRAADVVEGGEHLIDAACDDAARNDGAGRGQQFLGLIFVDFHGFLASPRISAAFLGCTWHQKKAAARMRCG